MVLNLSNYSNQMSGGGLGNLEVVVGNLFGNFALTQQCSLCANCRFCCFFPLINLNFAKMLHVSFDNAVGVTFGGDVEHIIESYYQKRTTIKVFYLLF